MAATEVATEPQQQEHQVDTSSTQLKFKESLTWRVGKPIPVAELLRRLESLSKEMRTIQQELADRQQLLPIAKELASSNLVNHKDAGVRAWTACCVVEMFRLCAPDAPYNATQMKVRWISRVKPNAVNAEC
jgi:sister chromatid cohesion protein PDS5